MARAAAAWRGGWAVLTAVPATRGRVPRVVARAVSATTAAGDGRAPAAAEAATALLAQLAEGMPALGGGEGEGMEGGGVWRRESGGLRGRIE